MKITEYPRTKPLHVTSDMIFPVARPQSHLTQTRPQSKRNGWI